MTNEEREKMTKRKAKVRKPGALRFDGDMVAFIRYDGFGHYIEFRNAWHIWEQWRARRLAAWLLRAADYLEGEKK